MCTNKGKLKGKSPIYVGRVLSDYRLVYKPVCLQNFKILSPVTFVNT